MPSRPWLRRLRQVAAKVSSSVTIMPAFAGGDLLVGVEREDAGPAEGADRPVAATCAAEAFAGVFDEDQLVLLGDLLELDHAAGVAERLRRATIALVLGVIAAATLSTSMLRVCGSMSTKTGLAPTYRMQLAQATKEKAW